MKPLQTVLLSAVLFAWPALAFAQGPRVSVIMPPTAGNAAPQSAGLFEAALRDHGAVIVPSQGIPSGQPAAAPRAPVDGFVELQIQRVPKQARKPGMGRYQAQLEVLDPQGSVRLVDQVPLEGKRLSRKEAQSLATLAVGAIAAPQAAENTPPPMPNEPPYRELQASEPKAPQATSPAPPSPPATFVPNPPRQDQRRILVFSAVPNLTWRSAQSGASVSGQSLHFGTSSPYPGLELGFATQPFLSPAARWLGFDISYSFSYTQLNSSDTRTALPSTSATENRLLIDLVGHVPPTVLGGLFTARLGFAYEGFIVNTPTPPLVSTMHFGPRIALDYEHPIYHSISFDIGGGYRPLVTVGGALQSQYGGTTGSFGVDAHAGVSGSLNSLFKGLRWVAGYDFLRYSDHFAGNGSNARIPYNENYNRFDIGLTYAP